MNTGRQLAQQHLAYLVPLVTEIWNLSPDSTETELAKARIAVDSIEHRIALLLDELEEYYDEEIIAVLRCTSSVNQAVTNWRHLLRETKELFESRLGVEKTKSLLVGLI